MRNMELEELLHITLEEKQITLDDKLFQRLLNITKDIIEKLQVNPNAPTILPLYPDVEATDAYEVACSISTNIEHVFHIHMSLLDIYRISEILSVKEFKT